MSQRAHEAIWRAHLESGRTGRDATFDASDLDVLLASRFAPAPGPLLDLGCGGGETSVYFAQRGFQVTAVDFAPSSLRIAERAADAAGVEVELRLADLRSVPDLGVASFETVIDHRALHCLVEPEHRAHCLGVVHRSLRPRGLFYSSTLAGMPRGAEDVAVDPVTRVDTTGTRYFGDPTALLGELRRAGFEIAAFQVVREPYTVDNLITYARKPAVDGGFREAR